MSLRREQAELQRALELSTQSAHIYALMPPHTLSSSSSSNHSREFELRPVQLTANTPVTPLRPPRDSFPLSPDGDDSPHPASAVEVVIASRNARFSSPDPIDSLHSPTRFMDSAETRFTMDPPALPAPLTPALPSMPSKAATSKSGASSASEPTGRVSARVQKRKEEESALAAERKRKRDERRAREAAEREAAIAAGELSAVPEKKTRKKRESQPKAAATLADIPSESQLSKEPQSTQSKASQSKSGRSQPGLVTSQSKSPPAVAPPTEITVSTVSTVSLAPSENDPASGITAASTPVTAPKAPHSSELEPIETIEGNPASPNEPTPQRSPSAQEAQSPVTRPLQPARCTPSGRASPSGITWKAPRNDLNSVLSKFPSTRRPGMSKKLRIAPLHMHIGPPAKVLPPPPPKASKKKCDNEDEDDDDEAEGKVKVGSREWLMMED